MQYCSKCNIKIAGNKKSCPLCEGEIAGTPDLEAAAFPVIRVKKSYGSAMLKIAGFIALIYCVVMCILMVTLPGRQGWAWLSMGIVLLVWTAMAITRYYRYHVIFMVSMEIIVFMIILYIIDKNSGMHGWSVTWLIPILFPVMAAVQICIGRISKMYLEEYVIHPLLAAVLSLIQILLLRENPFPLPALISMAFMAVMTLAVFIFRFRDLQQALSERLHM